MNNSSGQKFARCDKIFSDSITVSLDLLKVNHILLGTTDDDDDDTVSRQSANLGIQMFDIIKKFNDDFIKQSDQYISQSSDERKMLKLVKPESKQDNLNQFDNDVTINNKESTNTCNIIVSNQTLVVEKLTADLAEKSSAHVQDFADSEEKGASVLSEVTHSVSVESNDEDDKVSECDKDVYDNCSTSSEESYQCEKNTHVNKYTKPALDAIERKIKVAKMMQKHPHWSMRKLRKRSGYKAGISRRNVYRWIDELETGGPKMMRIRAVNQWVYAKCCEYRDKKKKITKAILHKWAVQGNKILFAQYNRRVPWEASCGWLKNFKKSYHISGRSSDLKIESSHQATENKSSVENLKKINGVNQCICWDKKVKVVKLARRFPELSLDMLREQSGYGGVITNELLLKWKEEVKNGGNIVDKSKALNKWVYSKAVNYIVNNDKVTNKLLIGLGLEAKRLMGILNTNVNIDEKWLCDFKTKYDIHGRSSDLEFRNL